ncbi:hypothetical protein BB559_004653 [Furculomyces boomerangus]|uniref:Fe2OG dioxygenase domain-containing protein n=2 Tax=Harpellales TaxID=61421 RepID=A0A2T9YDH8_9FUNG|nr:hypothetical protein BB559_004653 [Furculomyces boomerangus]PVZ98711.1 hypothetical protein BB558_005288 [Smittium angustum]
MQNNKKVKLEHEYPKLNDSSISASNAQAWFNHNLLENKDLVGTLKLKYEESVPYKYCNMKSVFNEDLIKCARDEIIKLNFVQKETDIYSYHQSGDLANLDGLGEKEQVLLPNLKSLRDAIYSKEFRSVVSEITGCGPISGIRTDMSANIYYSRDHLLLHDDVIDDRKVSFILYFPETETGGNWNPRDGGALELYPSIDNTSVPENSPVSFIPLEWNQMVFFVVEPGKSHHAVQEVVSSSEKTRRISIQGWFHYPQPGEDGYEETPKSIITGISTLQQIQEGDELAPYNPYTNNLSIDDCQLLQSDVEYLKQYMNPEYLKESVMKQTADLFADQSFIQLGKFIKSEIETDLEQLIKSADKIDGLDKPQIPTYGTGECGRWRARGPPVIRRYLELDSTTRSNTAELGKSGHDELAEQLSTLRDRLFCSEQFRRWLLAITQSVPNAYRSLVRRFRPGADYVLASPTGNNKPTIDAILCLTPVSSIGEAEIWKSGKVGGYECYLTIDENDKTASVYKRTSDDDPLLTVPVFGNTLNLVYCEEDVYKFIKYVSASAPRSRLDIFNEYQID